MLGLNKKLKSLKDRGGSIKIAVAGIGQMGMGLISHIGELDGMQVVAVANRDAGRISSILQELEISSDKLVLAGCRDRSNLENDKSGITVESGTIDSSTLKRLNQLAGKGKIIVSDNLDILFVIDDVDIIIDATGSLK